jgi:ADP-ribose pyrophosphatase YjhB (NUDIX family)
LRTGGTTAFTLDPGRATHQVDEMAEFVRRVPEGDDRERLICAECGYVAYENPKIIVGSVVVAGERVLMCRRAIEPRRTFWTLPAGFMEMGETLEEGAAREAREEAEAVVTIEGILGVFSVARIGQVQIIFRARFADPGEPTFRPGPESLDVRLFRWDEIPWDEIAFPSVNWALDAWKAVGSAPIGAPKGNPAHDLRGVHGLTNPPAGRFAVIPSALIFLAAFCACASAADLPVPPVPPAMPPATDVAPVPNPDVEAPVAPNRTSVNMKFYQVKVPDPSLGFSPGSQYQNTEDRKPVHTPGLSLSVPIQ